MTQRTWLAALCALAAFPAQGRVVDSSASGFTVENVVVVPVDAQKAWDALVGDVDRWWPKEHSWWGKDGKFTIDPVAGGCFCERSGARQAMHMTIGFVDPARTLRMLGGLGPLQGMGLSGALDWKLAPAEGGTQITLRYVAGGYTTQDLTQFAVIVDQVQGLQLGGLASFLGAKK